ncbi:helix-turn-helix transcriptional regulator [Roseomonas sp. CCTCC AB2023176]|uniref:helix-turn-helix transcriptional regulator n=1 Tax=Roseomonas sp. CCTCC AB2023176 TaxID=3342640 RepID=UPI0035D94CCB
MSPARVLAVTEEIYDAATGGTPWAVVGASLTALLRARTISLMAGDVLAGEPEILCAAEVPPDGVTAYRRHYRHVDLWTKRAAAAFAHEAAHGPPRVSVSGTLVPEAEFVESEFYREFGRHHGLRYVVGSFVPLGAAGAMPIGLHRPAGAAPFGDPERKLLSAVLPHLRRAMQLRHRLGAAAGDGSAPAPGLGALDALSQPLLILDADMHVLVANLAAEAVTSAEGAALRLRRAGHLRAAARTVLTPTHRADRVALEALVRATAFAQGTGGAIRLRDAQGVPSLAGLVTPLPRRIAAADGGGIARVEGRALLLLREIGRSAAAPNADVLRGLFGLTRAEADIVRSLAGGATKAAVATARGLRETTVRTHVRSVLDKTGAANLRDLERMLAGLEGM